MQTYWLTMFRRRRKIKAKEITWKGMLGNEARYYNHFKNLEQL